MLVDIGIHAPGIGVKESAVAGGKLLRHALRHGPETKRALLLVIVHPALARARRAGASRNRLRRRAAGGKNFSHLAAYGAPRQVHLPEPVLRRNITLGKEEVLKTGGGDMRDALRVPQDGDRRLQARERDRAIELRQR